MSAHGQTGHSFQDEAKPFRRAIGTYNKNTFYFVVCSYLFLPRDVQGDAHITVQKFSLDTSEMSIYFPALLPCTNP